MLNRGPGRSLEEQSEFIQSKYSLKERDSFNKFLLALCSKDPSIKGPAAAKLASMPMNERKRLNEYKDEMSQLRSLKREAQAQIKDFDNQIDKLQTEIRDIHLHKKAVVNRFAGQVSEKMNRYEVPAAQPQAVGGSRPGAPKKGN